MVNVLIAAGSPDSLRLIEKLQVMSCKITVLNLYRQIFDSLTKMKGIKIITGLSTADDFGKLIELSKTNIIIDESSPFSATVSSSMMDAAKAHGIVYCRYEGRIFDVRSENIIFAKDNAHCIEILNRREGRALLTIGSSDLHEYINVKNYESRLFVKVLPTVAAIERCELLKIPPENIFAINGKITKSFLVELITHSGASVIVSKDVSTEGGIERKIEAAEESGIPIILINRPEIQYINKFRDIAEIMRFIENAALPFDNE